MKILSPAALHQVFGFAAFATSTAYDTAMTLCRCRAALRLELINEAACAYSFVVGATGRCEPEALDPKPLRNRKGTAPIGAEQPDSAGCGLRGRDLPERQGLSVGLCVEGRRINRWSFI